MPAKLTVILFLLLSASAVLTNGAVFNPALDSYHVSPLLNSLTGDPRWYPRGAGLHSGLMPYMYDYRRGWGTDLMDGFFDMTGGLSPVLQSYILTAVKWIVRQLVPFFSDYGFGRDFGLW